MSWLKNLFRQGDKGNPAQESLHSQNGMAIPGPTEALLLTLKHNAIVMGYILVGGICGLVLNTLIFSSPLAGIFPAPAQDSYEWVLTPGGLALSCILSPLIEELIFRKGVFLGLRKRIPYAPAAALSSFLFAIFHMNMLQGTYAFLMGMIMCALYEEDGGFRAPLAFHIGANLMALYYLRLTA